MGPKYIRINIYDCEILKNRMDKESKILNLLKKSKYGLTITELSNNSKFSRLTVRMILAKLEGAKNVSYRKIGMAKIYALN